MTRLWEERNSPEKGASGRLLELRLVMRMWSAFDHSDSCAVLSPGGGKIEVLGLRKPFNEVEH